MVTNSPAANLVQLLEALEHQNVSNTDVSNCLKANDLQSHWGWKKLKTNLVQLPADKIILTIEVLSSLLLNKVLCGDKELQIFELDDAQVADVFNALSTIGTPNSDYSPTFPRALPPERLARIQDGLKLSKKIEHDNGDVSLVLCGVKSEFDRNTYKFNEVTTAVQEAFSGFDSFITVKRHYYQIFEVITFRRSYKRIEVLIDQPGRMHAGETVEDRCLQIMGTLATQCQTLNQLYENHNPLNLYSCINAIYSNKSEGKIKSLAFRSPSRSNKRESMNSEDDLRLDDFHAAGIAKVVTITVYDIQVVWQNLVDGVGLPTGFASAHIKTPVGSLSAEGGYVSSASVKSEKIGGIASIANKLISYIQS